MQNRQKKAWYTLLIIILIIFPAIYSTLFYYNDFEQSIPVQGKSYPEPRSILPNSRVVRPSKQHDANSDKIADTLSDLLHENIELASNSPGIMNDKELKVDVLICVNQKPDSALIDKIRSYGVEISRVYDNLIYAVEGTIPAYNVSALAMDSQVTLIEKQATSHTLLDSSTVNMGVRGSSYVWDATPNIKGNPNYAIAIIDTGIDSNHSDMENLIDYRVFTNEGYSNGTFSNDYGHHGTHVASIAAGTGAADTTLNTVNETISSSFPSTVMYYYPTEWFEVRDNINNQNTTVTLTWDNSSGGGVNFGIYSNSTWIITLDNYSINPIIKDLGNLDAGWYQVVAKPNSSATVNKNYTITIEREYNYTLDNESTNAPIYAGVAPESNLVSLKVLNDTGSGEGSWFFNALDWISNNGKDPLYNITTVSMSLGFDGIYASIDNAINNLVAEGFICVVAAGNNGTGNGYNGINSPGTAEKAITVGAVNNAFEVVYYSSNGNNTIIKPDVIAPGGTIAISGSSSPHNLIIAADSNHNESGNLMYDAVPNDYVGMQGTSMAAPHVSGLAQLVIDAIVQKEGNWSWSEANALRVKHLITMGTWEVNAGETYNGDGDNTPQDPSLDRIGRDKTEGYGMVRADAVIQAVTHPTENQFSNVPYYLDRRAGSHAKDPKVLLFSLNATVGINYTFTLSVPATGDFDLIIYDTDYNTSSGTPIVFISSINNGTGVNESLVFIPTKNDVYYWSVRAAQGYGVVNVSMVRSDNSPPNAPTDPSPTNGTSGVGTSPTLRVNVSDPDGDLLKVSFYNGLDDSLIGAVSGVYSGGTASIIWSDLTEGISYNWSVVIEDVAVKTNSSLWSFTTFLDIPIWEQTPMNQIIEINIPFIYDVNASDLSGISQYWLNDTSYFVIDNNGIITNTTILPIGKFWLEIRAYDPSTNYAWAVISITVQSTSKPEISGYNIWFIFGVIYVFSVLLIKKRKKTGKF